MALNTGKILMRRGQEANFDPSKMMPGEWAVSLDSRYVRMCFSPGVCVRMATYEAFEADMGQIRQILAECQTVEEAVQRIYEDIKDVAVDVERIELAAENALRSEEVASNRADVAIAAAEEAIKKAEEAAASESTASEKAQEAVGAAETATQKASEAAESADNVRNMSEVSQSYAVGGTGTRVGEDTDNAMYYNQQASDNADRAEAAAERAAAVADVGVATTEKAGIVKPDGTTVTVDPDGTIHVKEGTKNYNDLENKPRIGGVELLGDQTPDELGLVGKTDFEEFSNQTTEAVEILGTGLERTTFKVDTIIEKADLGIKETVSGERIYLDDSADGKVVEFGLYGKARQETTTGKQLIPYPFYESTKTINGVTFTDNGDGTVKANGTNSSEGGYAHINLIAGTSSVDVIKSLGAGSYVLNGCPNGGSAGSYCIMFTINTGGSWSTKAIDYGSGAAFELTDDEIANITEANVNIRVYGIANNLTFYPMIRLSSISDGTWEPYTGGIPSPSPEYPQEIEVAGESGSVEVKSVGKNLLKNTATSQTSNGVTFTVNADGSVATSGEVTAWTDYKVNKGFILKKGTYIASCGGAYQNPFIRIIRWSDLKDLYSSVNGDEGTFTLKEDAEVFAQISATNTREYTNCTFYTMIRLASDTDSTYEPYKETQATIPTENGLAGIPVDSGGNYTDQDGQQWICDEIVKFEDGSGEYVQRIGSKVFDGSESWIASTSQYSYLNRVVISEMFNKTDNPILCNLYQQNAAGRVWGENYERSISQYLNEFRIYDRNYNTSDITPWKTFLSEQYTNGNPLTVFFELAEPIRTPLTAEQIAEIEKLYTFYPVTHISNDFDAGMKVKYKADAKSYIDNRLALIEQAMLNSI